MNWWSFFVLFTEFFLAFESSFSSALELLEPTISRQKRQVFFPFSQPEKFDVGSSINFGTGHSGHSNFQQGHVPGFCRGNRIYRPECRQYLNAAQHSGAVGIHNPSRVPINQANIPAICRVHGITSPQCRQYFIPAQQGGGGIVGVQNPSRVPISQANIPAFCRGHRITNPECRQYLIAAQQASGGSIAFPHGSPDCRGNRKHLPECQGVSGGSSGGIGEESGGGSGGGGALNCRGNRKKLPECQNILLGGSDNALSTALEQIPWLQELTADNVSLLIPGLPKTPTSTSQQTRFYQLGLGATDTPFQTCGTPRFEPGHCRYIQHCVLPEFINNFNVFLRYVCFINGIYVGVCCPDSRYPDFNPTTRATTLPTTTPRPPTPPNSRGCGINSITQTKIVGGKDAELNKFPWAAALLKGATGSPTQYCGGVLISNQHVLTAAHCVDGFDAKTITIRLGEYSFNQQTNSAKKDFGVSAINMHENYDRQTYVNDIAVMVLDRTTEFSKAIWEVCLPPPNELFVGQTATVIGWGTIYFGGPISPVLQEVSIPVWTNEECKAAYKDNEVFPLNLCAGDKAGGKDSCQGDSGGPLMLQYGPEKRWMVIGVVSWGIRCADPGIPGVYARVSEFLPWIQTKMGT